MKAIAAFPRTAPVGGTRNVRPPRSAPAGSMPTAPVSQNSMPFAAASTDAGSEIVLP